MCVCEGGGISMHGGLGTFLGVEREVNVSGRLIYGCGHTPGLMLCMQSCVSDARTMHNLALQGAV